MSIYTPDKWVVVQIEGEDIVPLTYKVFACWYGGYLGSNSWKMNSGICSVKKENNYFLFEGYSGSIYKCHGGIYGTHMYGGGVLNEIISESKKVGVNIDVLPEDTNWLELPQKSSNIEE